MSGAAIEVLAIRRLDGQSSIKAFCDIIRLVKSKMLEPASDSDRRCIKAVGLAQWKAECRT